MKNTGVMRHFLMIACIFIGSMLKGQNQFNPEWIKFFGSTYMLDLSSARISLDQHENIFFTLSGIESIFIDSITTTDESFGGCTLIGKFDSSGAPIWTKRYEDPGNGCATVNIQNQALTPDGGVVIEGYYYGTVNYDGYYLDDNPDAPVTFFLHKINAAGDHVAFLKFDSVYLRDMVISRNGDITVSVINNAINPNMLVDSVITSKYLLFQLDSNFELNYILEQDMVIDDEFYTAKYIHLAVDTIGNTYAGYAFDHNSVIDGINYTGQSYSVTILDSVEVWDVDSMYYEYYTYEEIIYDVEGVLAKYDADGNMLWHALIEGGNYQYFYSITCEGGDEVYAIASTSTVPGEYTYLNDSSLLIPTTYDEPPYRQNVFLKFDATGNVTDYKISDQNKTDLSKSVVLKDHFYVSGSDYTESYNSANPALWCYDTSFALTQFAEASCPEYLGCDSKGVVIDIDVAEEHVYILSSAYLSVYLDEHFYNFGNDTDMYFIAKLPLEYGVPHVIPDSVQFINAEINVYPNPVSNILHIATNLPDGEITACYIANTLGQHWPFVPEQINLNMWQVNVHMLRRGAYVIYYELNENMHAATFVKM